MKLAVNRLGWKADESVIGKKIVYPAVITRKFEVIAYTDFHFGRSIHLSSLWPWFHYKGRHSMRATNIRGIAHGRPKPVGVASSIESMKTNGEHFAEDKPFQFSFVIKIFAKRVQKRS